MNETELKELARKLDESGEIEFAHEDYYYHIWETEQGDCNIRGESFMNYMIDVYEKQELMKCNYNLDEASECDGGLCTGDPKDAIEFMMERREWK